MREGAFDRGVPVLERACLLAGRIEDALEAATRALTVAREHRERGNEAGMRPLVANSASDIGERGRGNKPRPISLPR